MRIKHLSITVLILMLSRIVQSQPPGWEVDLGDFEYSASFTWQFEFTSVNVIEEGDSLAAFVGDELRGAVEALLHPGFQEYFFPILVYSNTISGEEVTFKYYDVSADRVMDIELGHDDQQVFVLDRASGSFSDPLTAIIDDLIPQEITFEALEDKIFGDGPFELVATGGESGNAITFTSSDVEVVTIDGTTATIIGAGNVIITASQLGNDFYADALPVEQELTVLKAEQKITFDALVEKTFGDAPFELTFTGGNSGNDLALVSSDESVATINGTTVTIIGAGSTSIIASQAGNENYQEADPVEQNLTVNKAPQTIIFDAPGERIFGDAPFGLSFSGGNSGNDVFFMSSDETIAIIDGSTVTIVGIGSITITASQAGDDNYEDAVPVEQNLTVSKASQTIVFEALPEKAFGDDPFELAATGGESDLLITFSSSDESVATVSGSTVMIVGVGTTEITASQLGDDTYDPATDVIQTLTVNKASQIITLEAIGSKLITDPPTEVVATVNTGFELTYELTGPATITGNIITLSGTSGIVAVTVTQVGNDNYDAASATETFEVIDPTKDDQSINFSDIADKTYGDADFSLNANVTSGLQIEYRVVNGPVTIDDDVVTITGTGEVTIEASQSGDDDYNPAISVEQTFVVAKANLHVTANDQTRLYGAENPALTVSYEGLVNDDEASDLQTLPTVATTGGQLSDVATYTISVEGAADDNYAFEYTAGTLTIEQAPLVITADDQMMTYGDSLPELTLSYSGFVNDEIDTVLNVQPVVSTLATIASDVDSYAILLEGGEDNNYAFELISGVLEITPAALVVSADSVEAVYGSELPVFTISYAGFKNEDSEADIIEPSASSSAEQGSFPGIYPIILTGGEATNYEIRLEGSVLEVTKAPLKVQAVNDTIIYGDEMPEPKLTYTGFVQGGTVEVLDSPPLATLIADPSSDAGEYEIAVAGGSSELYSFNYINGTLVIKKAQATIVVTDLEQVADGEPKLPTIITDPEGLSYEIAYNGETEPPSLPGEYSVDITITETNYEGTTSLLLLIEGSVTAVESESRDVLLYPNPVQDILSIEVTNGSLNKVEVYNLNGVLMMGRPLVGNKAEIDVQAWPTGMYLIRLMDDNNETLMQRKFIKE